MMNSHCWHPRVYPTNSRSFFVILSRLGAPAALSSNSSSLPSTGLKATSISLFGMRSHGVALTFWTLSNCHLSSTGLLSTARDVVYPSSSE